MPWIKGTLRGNTVYVRATKAGQIAVEGGRVEVRYRPSDGKLYKANPANITLPSVPELLPDDFCAPAEAAAKSAKGSSAKASSKTPSASSAQLTPLPGSWEAWTDGACSGNPGPAGLGMILIHDNETLELSEYLGQATNNIAELTAILRALEAVPEEQPLRIRTDSQYSIGVLQKGWKAKANTELIASIKSELKNRPWARLEYTPGHAGVALNERADELARRAISNRKTEIQKRTK